MCAICRKGPDKFRPSIAIRPGRGWASNVEHDFDPLYIVPPGKAAQVRKLKALVKDAKDLYLATDEDREGEAISWHLNELLKPEGAGPSAGVPRDHEGGHRGGVGPSAADR